MVPNLAAVLTTVVVTTAGLFGGGGGLTAGARRGRLAPPPRLDWEADLVTPGGLLGSGGPVLLRPAAGVGLLSVVTVATALRLGLWIDGGGAGGGPRGLTSAGNGAGARRTGGVSLGNWCWRLLPMAGLEEGGSRGGGPEGTLPAAVDECPAPGTTLPADRNFGIPPTKSPAKPGGAATFPEPFDGAEELEDPPFLAPSITGALRSLVTAFFSAAPPRICDNRADRSGAAAVFRGLGGPRPPMEGGGGGGGGMACHFKAGSSATKNSS